MVQTAVSYSICCSANFLDPATKTLGISNRPATYPHQMKDTSEWLETCSHTHILTPEKNMLTVHTENIGEMAVIECEGRIVRSEAAFELRKAVNLQSDAQIIVLDLSEVTAIEAGGLGMLVFLQRWALDHDIRLKLFNPRPSVRQSLERASSMREFDIATLDEMMALLASADRRYAQAA